MFGEKYGDQVRVVSMGDFSTELCGGTHVDRTGDIGLFKLLAESGIAAGVRRIEAVTGEGALAFVAHEEAVLKLTCDILKTGSDGLVERVQQMTANLKSLEKQIEQLKAKRASEAGTDIADEAEECNGIKVLAKSLEGFSSKALRDTVDQLKNKLGSAIVVLACIEDGKVSLVAGVSKDLVDKVKAGDLVNMVALQVGGKGGGRADMAMAGGSEAGALPAALASVKPWVLANM